MTPTSRTVQCEPRCRVVRQGCLLRMEAPCADYGYVYFQYDLFTNRWFRLT